MWPDHRIQDLFEIELPIIQAPMAGSVGSEMVIAVSEAGGLGSLPCAMLSPEQMRNELGVIRQRTSRPINLNFFCHQPPQADPARENAWKQRLESYYVELGLDPQAPVPAAARAPFDSTMCDLVEEFTPEVVSFHFGLPERALSGTRQEQRAQRSSRRPPQWMRRDGWRIRDAMPSLPKATRPVGIVGSS